jgi:hypothetical protein
MFSSGWTDVLSPRPLFLLLALAATAPAQDATLRDSFLQGKSLWSNQGEREAASTRFEQVVAVLEPKAKDLPAEWRQVLCEAYNWLAVLDDRSPTQKARASRDLEAIIDLDPDFEIDRTITPARLQAHFDSLRGSKLARVKFTYSPEGGVLLVDGRPSSLLPTKLLPVGPHRLVYSKPGYAPAEKAMEALAKEGAGIEFQLTRTSSTLTVLVHPPGAEILLDGKSLGRAGGIAPALFSSEAVKAGLKLEELSAPFLVTDLSPGRHIMELRAACYTPRKIEITPELTQPFQDQILEPFLLKPSKGFLTVTSSWDGGELLLDGTRQGPLPVQQLPVCSGTYSLEVRFPSGGFARTVEIENGKPLALAVKPKPRMLFLGFAGDDEFTGRARLQTRLNAFGEGLGSVAFINRSGSGAPLELLPRLKATHEGELFLRVEAHREGSGHHVELVLATPEGEEERFPVKPLEQDPLAQLQVLLNQPLRLQEPWVGLSLIDVPGEPGPWVLQAQAGAASAGIVPFKPITQVNGHRVGSVEAFRKELEAAPAGPAALEQEGRAISLPVVLAPLEIPTGDPGLSYALLLAELRLKLLGAKGEAASVLRFQQALALMHFRKFERAVELLRDARGISTPGIGQGTLDFYTGICLLRLGNAYAPEAIQAFAQAAQNDASRLFGPEGPLVAPLARQAIEDHKLR